MLPTLDELGLNHLSAEDRLSLAELLRDSVAAELQGQDTTPAQAAELERRVALADADPSRGIPWEIVRAEERGGLLVRHPQDRGGSPSGG